MMCVYIQAAWKLQSFFHHPSLFSLPVVIHPSPGPSPLLLFSYYTHYRLITSSSIELWTKAQVPLKPVEREFLKTDDFFFFLMIWLHSQNCKCLTLSQHSMVKLLQPVTSPLDCWNQKSYTDCKTEAYHQEFWLRSALYVQWVKDDKGW